MMEYWNNVKTFRLYILIKSLESNFVVYPISLLSLRNKTHYSTILLFRFSDCVSEAKLALTFMPSFKE